MRNAGPIESPTDPFASVPLPTSATSRKPRIEGLPPGVSRDIFGGVKDAPQATAKGQDGGSLPPVATPAQPWPVNEGKVDPPIPPAPVFGLPGQQDRPPALLDPDPPRRGRLLPAILVLVVMAAVLAYLVPAVMMSGSVLRGTRVGGVDIGGLTMTQAADKLRAELAARLSKPVAVDIAGKRETIQPDEAGLELDVVGTINQAPSGFPSPVEVWRGLTGTTELEPKVTVDASQLTRTVEGLAEAYDKAPREGRVAFRELRPVAAEPQDGALLDREDAVRVITDAFLHARGSAALTIRPAKPQTTVADVTAAKAEALQAIAAPLTLAIDGKRAELSPSAIAAHLTYASDGKGGLAPQFDAKAALAGIESSLIDESQAPRDATYEIVNGKPELVPARAGRGVDDRQLARDVARVITGDGPRVIPVKLDTVRPEVATSEVKDLGITANVGEFTTTFDCCQPRAINIQRMAAQLDGRLVKPGETFSLNAAVGERTREKGYVEAGQIVGGRMVNIVGGGVSQFATTMYNAVFFAGFDDVEHVPMDYYAARYPAGRDVALLYPDLDLKWRNDSDHGVLIKATTTGTSVTVALWGTKRYDRIQALESPKRAFTPFRRETSSAPGCLPVTGQQGFTIDVTRVIFKGGEEVRRDRKLTTKYRPQAQVTCTVSTGTN